MIATVTELQITAAITRSWTFSGSQTPIKHFFVDFLFYNMDRAEIFLCNCKN